MRAGLRALREAGDTTTFEGMDPDGPLPRFVMADEICPRWSTRTEHVERRWPRSPPTRPRSPSTARSSRCPTTRRHGLGHWSSSGLVKGAAGPLGDDGLETDLFAGL